MILFFVDIHVFKLCENLCICELEWFAICEEHVSKLVFNKVTHKLLDLNPIGSTQKVNNRIDLLNIFIKSSSFNIIAIKRMRPKLVMFCSILKSVVLMPIVNMIWKLISVVYLISRVSGVMIEDSDHLSPSGRRPNESLDDRVHLNISIHLVFKRIPIKNDLIIMDRVFSILMFNSSRILILVFVIQNCWFSLINIVVKISKWNFFFEELILSCCIIVSDPSNIFKNTHRLWKFSFKYTKWKFRFDKGVEHVRTWLDRKRFIVV